MDSTEDKPWSPPSPEALMHAFAYHEKKRPRTVCRTIVFKLHKPTRRKERTLLWAQMQVTNMTAHILETLREEPGKLRPDGAIAVVLEMLSRKAQGQSGQRVQVLADVLSECFLRGKQRSSHSSKTKIVKKKPLDIAPLSSTNFPVTSVLRTGVFRQVGLMLLNWYVQIVGDQESQDELEITKGKEALSVEDHSETDSLPQSIPNLEAIHSLWSSKCRIYDDAKQVVIPFGRNRGETLEQAGKREVRWLKDRLVPKATIEATLEHIAILLDPLSRGEPLRKAKQARHPWRRRANLQRSPGAGRLVERVFDLPQPLIRLETLNSDELQLLQADLEEMRDFSAEFDKIRDAVEIFLGSAPPSYPNVRPILLSSERESQKTIYDASLDILGSNIMSLESESEIAADLLRSESALCRNDLQPLNFIRSIRPGSTGSSFALLCSKNEIENTTISGQNQHERMQNQQNLPSETESKNASYNYVLAIVVQGENAFASNQQAERFTPKVKTGLFYVNFPETPFVPPRGTSMLLLPLECGKSYHEQTFMIDMIHQQRILQHKLFKDAHRRKLISAKTENLLKKCKLRFRVRTRRFGDVYVKYLDRPKKPKASSECFPESAIGSAKIISKETEEGFREFYLHTPIIEPSPTQSSSIGRILGVHEHTSGYSYAIIDLSGKIIDVGNVFIPYHVRFEEGDKFYSNNYVFEVVKSIIDTGLANTSAIPSSVLIGLEKTDYRKSNVHLSRTQNRRLFKQPSKKVANVLLYKSLLAGLPKTHMTWGVSPRRCSACGRKRPSGIRNTYPLTVCCPTCKSTNLHCSRCGTPSLFEATATTSEGQPERKRSDPASAACPHCLAQHSYLSYELRCASCQHVWSVHEPHFLCPHCQHYQPAHLNTAIVVAQLTLSQLVLRAERDTNSSRPKREPKKSRKKSV